ncbi:MAG TPA: glutamate--tRNA ligase [Bacteroidales bacterium]|nr:glutamate--tRNA ligase [Bacteroidales bacterium]HRZ47968.1 glutamate--tRNA ligase [Bacteroidales bacterium]
MSVRVRFAPSPTGPLHIGGVRTALYNYLFAKKLGGTMILRIEDTDRSRFVPGAEDYIIESLQWCGIQFDEGVHVGGPFTPYRQSERAAMYREFVDDLLNAGRAYYAFDTPEELEQMRQRLTAKGVANPQYDHHVRMEMQNSLALSSEEVERRIRQGVPYVVRFKIPELAEVTLYDLVRGEVTVHAATLDDKVLFKSDGMPTYHLANVVDDHLMQITHVIRGEEWLPSAPLHSLLYEAFGWKAPEFAHLPLLLKPDGNGKLSKRDGDRLGFPVFPLEWKDPATGEVSSGYRESGYIPEAFINFLALLGWNPGTEQELFSMEELIEAFSIERISKKGAKFDVDKARWFNHQYLKNMDDDTLTDGLMALMAEKQLVPDREYAKTVTRLVRERAVFIKDLFEQGGYFFQAPQHYDEAVAAKQWKPENKPHLEYIAGILESHSTADGLRLKELAMQYVKENNLPTGQIMNSIRLALVGKSMGPDLFEIIPLLGVQESAARIRKALAIL